MIDWRKAYGFKDGHPTMDLSNACPRCGDDCPLHVSVKDFTVPVDQVGFVAFGWGMCRVLHEPFLIGAQKPWWWVSLFRWQLALIWKKQLQIVERVAPIYAGEFPHTEVTTANNANGASYVAQFGYYASSKGTP